MKICRRCDLPALPGRHWYCRVHTELARRRSGYRHARVLVSGAAAGYGTAHQRARAAVAPRVAAGVVACARCGVVIAPDEPWDLGHDDHDRSKYAGPEHRRCNRATAGRRHTPVAASSRAW